MKHIVNFSGGKDSTAMLLMMLEKGMPVDDIIFCDTGMEFPQMYTHIKKVEDYINRPITILQAEHDFEYYMFQHEFKKRDGTPCKGYSWPGVRERWCTKALKVSPINKFLRQKYNHEAIKQYIGIAYDEPKRHEKKADNVIHPLFDWKITEKEALEYCYSKGFTWDGLYDHFRRVSCWCCPLQGIKELRNLRKYHSELWAKLQEWDKKTRRSFHANYTAEQLEERFAKEEKWEQMQMRLF